MGGNFCKKLIYTLGQEEPLKCVLEDGHDHGCFPGAENLNRDPEAFDWLADGGERMTWAFSPIVEGERLWKEMSKRGIVDFKFNSKESNDGTGWVIGVTTTDRDGQEWTCEQSLNKTDLMCARFQWKAVVDIAWDLLLRKDAE